MTPSPPGPPPGFRGRWTRGEEARALASRVSGPFAATPAAWAAPSDLRDLQRLVEHASAHALPLVPRGGGTGMPGGNLGSGIVVSLAEAFQELGPVVPNASGTGARIRVGAGVRASTVDQAARAAGYHLPPLPSSAPWATVGGMLATNAAGARSFGRGATAAWVAGVEGILADGRAVALGDPDLESAPTLPPRTAVAPEWNPPDLLRSLASALPRERPRGWPRGLRKNSSGYGIDRWLDSGDPAQLVVGSEGTLLLVTHLTLRLAPIPQATGVVLVPVPHAAQAAALAVEASRLGATACEFLGRRLLDMAGLDADPELGPLSRDAWALFLLEFEGRDPAHLKATLDAVRLPLATHATRGRILSTSDPEQARRLWGLRHRASPLISDMAGQGLISTQFIEDSVVPPERLGEYLEGLDRILSGGDGGSRAGSGTGSAPGSPGSDARPPMDAVIFGHAGDGNVHVNPLVDLSNPAWPDHVRGILNEVVALVARLGGTMAGEHGDGRLRAPFLESIWGGDCMASFQALKTALDPGGILNPGVILPLPGQDPLDALAPRPRSWPEPSPE